MIKYLPLKASGIKSFFPQPSQVTKPFICCPLKQHSSRVVYIHRFHLLLSSSLKLTPNAPSASLNSCSSWTTSTCRIQWLLLSLHLTWPISSDTIDDHSFLLKSHSSLGFHNTTFGASSYVRLLLFFLSSFPKLLSFEMALQSVANFPIYSYFSSDHTPTTTLNTISILMTPKRWSLYQASL